MLNLTPLTQDQGFLNANNVDIEESKGVLFLIKARYCTKQRHTNGNIKHSDSKVARYLLTSASGWKNLSEGRSWLGPKK